MHSVVLEQWSVVSHCWFSSCMVEIWKFIEWHEWLFSYTAAPLIFTANFSILKLLALVYYQLHSGEMIRLVVAVRPPRVQDQRPNLVGAALSWRFCHCSLIYFTWKSAALLFINISWHIRPRLIFYLNHEENGANSSTRIWSVGSLRP